MAFVHINDAGFGLPSDDAPASSPAGVRCQANLEDCWQERQQKASVIFPYTSPFRACCCFPIAYGPLWTYIPTTRPSISLVLRVDEIVWSTSAGDDPGAGVSAIYLYATTMDSEGRYTRPPPVWQWGAVHITAAADQTITLEAETGRKVGWVGVLLWVCSVVSASAESSTTYAAGEISPGVIDVVAAPVYTTNPIERSLIVSIPVDKNVVEPASEAVMVGRYELYGADHLIHTAPPIQVTGGVAAYGDSYTVDYYTMGVISIASMAVEVQPGTSPVPGEWAFHEGMPIEEDTCVALAASSLAMSADLTRIILCWPGKVITDAAWRLGSAYRASGAGQWAALTTTYRVLWDGLLVEASPSGLRAILSLVRLVSATDSGDRVDPEIDILLSTYQIGVGVYDSNSATMSLPAPRRSIDEGPVHWNADKTGIARYTHTEAWQLEGALIDLDVHGTPAGTTSMGAGYCLERTDPIILKQLKVELEALTGTSYPCAVQLSAKWTTGAWGDSSIWVQSIGVVEI